MDWYWVWASFALASDAFYNAYEARKKSKELEERIRYLENKIK
jgi:hypothetical protein